LIHGLVRKFGLTMAAAAVLLFALLATGISGAQSTHRTRRESTANRKARIARTIAETYGHAWEAAGGGGYMRYRSGPYLQQNNEVSFWVTTQYTLNPKLGILGTVQGSYGKAKIGNTIYDIANPPISEYAFLAGPSYRFVGQEKYSVSGFVQGGMDLGKFAGASKGFTAAEIGVWQGDFAAAFTVGAKLEYNFDPSLSFRLMPEYLGTTFGSTLQNSKVLNVGFVYRFGHQK
jgi:hypothetical protein